MFSNKENVNMLTALLLEHGINTMVLCPGSRNTPLINNFFLCKEIKCFSVTDERSAGFYALGLAQNKQNKVGICVTSGSALLNVLPAVAEAFYQKIPFVVISADRPLAWINQLDGQTLPQTHALKGFVSAEVNLCEPRTEDELWHNNRLINQALIAFNGSKKVPVHINIPISEPLFNFSCTELPKVKKIESIENNTISNSCIEKIAHYFRTADRPMIVVGQGFYSAEDVLALKQISTKVVVLAEPLSGIEGISNFDDILSVLKNEHHYAPDVLLYVGNSMVSKRLKHFLRTQKKCFQIRISNSEILEDTFMNLSLVISGSENGVFKELNSLLNINSFPTGYQLDWSVMAFQEQFTNQWNSISNKAKRILQRHKPSFSQLYVVKHFEENIALLNAQMYVHYANSMAVRLANIYASHFVYCNRGVNGIEGCLSTAAGMSLQTQDKVFCVIGDLAFFYDQNALWNADLKGNLRILLLNNAGGGIFNLLPGAEQSQAHNNFIKANHETNAEGICVENKLKYLSATSIDTFNKALSVFLTQSTSRPIVLEVFTNQTEDAQALQNYYHELKKKLN